MQQMKQIKLILVVFLGLVWGSALGCSPTSNRPSESSLSEKEQPSPAESPPEEQPPPEAPPGEVQVTFTAGRTNLQPGECITLQWNVQGGFGVDLDGQPVERSGQKQVCPEETMIYSLAVDTGITIERREIELIVAGPEGPLPPESPPEPPSAESSEPSVVTDVIVHHDLEYAGYELEGGEYKLLLDLYLPQQDTSSPVPLLIFIHGGGWFEGSKEACPGRTFAQQGYAVACVDYRLAGCSEQLYFPAQIFDVKAAVRWLRQHANEYNVDPHHFGAMGDSSGGHLAALLGTSSGVSGLEGVENLGVSDAVQAVVDWFGPVDIRQGPIVFKDDPCATDMGRLNTSYGGEETPYFYWTLAWGLFLGGSLDDPAVLHRAAQATPLTHIDANDPPFLIIHGETDSMVPLDQSKLLASALNDAGVKATFLRLPEAGHGFGSPEQEVDPEFLEPTLKFFDTHLKGE